MVNYNDGKIYKLVGGGKIYIGSTTQRLSKRKSQHKKNKRCSSKELVEYDDFDIILIEKYPCQSKEELHARERYYIENMECVNKNIPGRNKKEYIEANKDKMKKYHIEYYKENKDRIKDYYEANKEAKKKYLEENKERIKEYQRKYNKLYKEANKKKINEYQKAYQKVYVKVNNEAVNKRRRENYQANKEAINKRRRENYQAKKEKQLKLKKGL